MNSIDASLNSGGVSFAQTTNGLLQKVVGSTAADDITVRNRVTVTGDGGNDVFHILAPSYSTTYSTITDAHAGNVLAIDGQSNTVAQQKLVLGSTATFQSYLNAATAGTTADQKAAWFQFGGDTYVVQNENAASTFQNGSDIVVKLAGLVGLSSATWAAGAITLNSGTTAAKPAATAPVANMQTLPNTTGTASVSFKHGGGDHMVGAKGVGDLTEVINDHPDSKASFKDIGKAAVTLDGVIAGDTTFIRSASGTVISDDLTINLKNGVKYGYAYGSQYITNPSLTCTIFGNDVSNGALNATINSTGAANSVLAMRLTHNTLVSLTINAATDLNVGNLTTYNGGVIEDLTGFDSTKQTSITIAGAGKVNLNDLTWAVRTVDASANTGGVTVLQSAPGQLRKLVGGSGADTFKIGSFVNVTGGAGADLFQLTTPKDGYAFSTINDFRSGDALKIAGMSMSSAPGKIVLGSTATYQNYLDAATASTAGDHHGAWFQQGGNTFVVQDNSSAATFQNGTDLVVKLVGQVDIGTAAWSADRIVAA